MLKFPKDIDEIEPVFTKQQTVAIAIHRNKAISKDKAKKSLYRKVFLCDKYENLSDIEFRTFKALNKRKELVFKIYAFTSFKKQNMSENFIRYSNLPTLELQNICCNQKNISKNTKLLLRKGKS